MEHEKAETAGRCWKKMTDTSVAATNKETLKTLTGLMEQLNSIMSFLFHI